MRHKNQFYKLARYPEDSDELFQAYLKATEATHVYLKLYLSQDTDDRLRFQTCTLPDDAPRVIYADIGM